ncbi:MAG: 50S ribosomal protein L4 [Akkermansiaceae bacterium]|nr:50S ribosomal protein L4 [Akkermansiaceae bacterium]NNM28342.1 50S ribosomal protein L4 [Akkermansiaceae bacterium]
MSAKTLSLSDAKAANLHVIEDGERGGQAVHDLVVAYQANRRTGSANSKTRGEVRGTGKKMYRQKGTGNARHGDRKAPIFVGGGVAFGPRPRDYSKRVPKKVRTLALRRVLGDLIAGGVVLVTPSFAIEDGKTKTFVSTVRSHTDAAKVLVVAPAFDEATLLSHRNVPWAMCIPASDVTVEELIYHDAVILTEDALAILASRTA